MKQTKKIHMFSAGLRPFALVAVAIMILGVNWPVMKLTLNYYPPLWMAALRFAFCIPVILLSAKVLGHDIRPPVRSDVPIILSIGILQFAGLVGLASFALQFIPAGRAAVLIYTTPLWVLCFQLVWQHAKPSIGQIACVGMTLAGLLTIILGNPKGFGGDGVLIGYGALLLGAFLWAICIVHISIHPWEGRPAEALLWQCSIAAFILIVVAGLQEGPLPLAVLFQPTGLALLIFLGAFATAFSFWCLIEAGRHLTPQTLAMASTLTPIIGISSSSLLLKEPLGADLLIGGGLIFVALIGNGIKRRK